MTDNFNIGDFDKIDEVVKNALGNFSETPSANLWSKMRWKLFRHDASNLFRFKKSVNPSMNPVTPVFKMAWVQVAAAAVVTVAVVSTIVYFTTSSDDKKDVANSTNNNNSVQKTPENNTANNTFDPANSSQNNNNEQVGNNNLPANNDVNEQQSPSVNKQQGFKTNDQGIHDKNNQKNQSVNTNTPADQNNKENYNLTDQTPSNSGTQGGNNPVYNNGANNINPVTDKIKDGEKPVDTVVQTGPDKTKLQGIGGNVDKPELNNQNDQANENVPDEVIDSINNGQWLNDPQTNDDENLIIPNAINPNNDGRNDYFMIPGIDRFPVNTLIIFDRNGKIIFEKSDYQNDWDARGYPGGSYYYVFTYKKKDGTDKMVRGMIFVVK